MPRPDFTLAGNLPEVHGMHAARKSLEAHPHDERWVVGRIVRVSRTHHTPVSGDPGVTMVLAFTSIDPIAIPDDVNTLQEIVARARADRPGQATLEDATTKGGDGKDAK
jgi:hypothetical protein